VTVGLEGGDSVEGEEILVPRRPQAAERWHRAGERRRRARERGFLEVDDQPDRGSDWLYAIGDVNGRRWLTHMGKYQARIASDPSLAKERRRDRGAPRLAQVTFTDPQLQRSARPSRRAKGAGIDARAVDIEIESNRRGELRGQGHAGKVPAGRRRGRKVPVGATFVGSRPPSSCRPRRYAIIGEVPLEKIWHAVPAYPTRSECG